MYIYSNMSQFPQKQLETWKIKITERNFPTTLQEEIRLDILATWELMSLCRTEWARYMFFSHWPTTYLYVTLIYHHRHKSGMLISWLWVDLSNRNANLVNNFLTASLSRLKLLSLAGHLPLDFLQHLKHLHEIWLICELCSLEPHSH